MTRFPPFRLDTRNHCLWKDEAQGKAALIDLAPKSFDVLRYLIENAGRLVRHGELLDAIWHGSDVQPEVLKGHILAIRGALDDNAQQPQFIETHRGLGYRFVAAVDNSKFAQEPAPQPAGTAPFVGRESELGRLHAALETAMSGKPGIVFVSGDPGIGKTALIEHFVEHFVDPPQRATMHVAIGRSIESHGTGEPYFPVFEALANLIAGDSQQRSVDILVARAPSWALQLPGLIASDRWAALQRQVGGIPRNRLIGEFCDFVAALTTDRPLLLVLEDLHWADFSTIDLLKAIASRRSAARLLVIGTYRREIASYRKHPVEELVRNLLPYAMCGEMSLPPLDEDDVSVMTAMDGTREKRDFAAFIAREAGGNPLYVTLILEHLSQKKLIERGETGWRLLVPVKAMAFDAPVSLANVVELQVQQLSPFQQVLLECASIFDGGCDAASVAALDGLDESDTERELEALGACCLFIERGEIEYPDDGLPFRRYLFKHAVHRSAFYERQAPTRRARRHLAAARLLDKPDADPLSLPSELARHFEAAGAWAKALDRLRLVLATAKRRFARRDAIAIIERAESLILRLPGDQRDAHMLYWLEEKAAILAANHDLAARAAYESLVDMAATRGLTDVRVRALLGLAFVHSWLDVASCLATLEQVKRIVAVQEPSMQSMRTRISCDVWTLWVGGWNPDAARECSQLIDEVRRSEDRVGAAWSMVEYSMVCLLSARYQEAQDLLAASAAILLTTPTDRADPASARATWMASLGVPWSDMLQGKLGKALERFESNITMLEKNDSPYAANMLRLMRAQLNIHALDFDAVRDECACVMRSIEERAQVDGAGDIASLPGERRTCQIMVGVAQVGLGNMTDGIGQLLEAERSMSTQQVNFDWYRLLFLDWSLAGAYAMQGDLANARLRADTFLARARATDERCWHALAFDMAARVAVLAGQHETAMAFIAQAIDTVDAFHVPLATWRVYRTAATIYADREPVRADEYAKRFLHALEHLIESLPPGHRLRMVLGLQR